MELMSIKGDTVELLYHPGESTADVGQQFAVTESDNNVQGLVIQVIANESLEYAGQQQEMIQNILEDRLAEATDVVIDRENGLDDIRNLKRAIAKIRKRIQGTEWVQWDGWIPTRNVTITAVSPKALMEHILPAPATPLRSFTRFQNTAVHIDGPRLDMVNVITGVKGSGKSHLAKNILYALSEVGVPCIVYDVNGEYAAFPRAQILRWGQNFRPNLADVGYEVLETLVRDLYPLNPGSPSESVFEARLRNIFNQRRQRCENNHETFTIDIPLLQQATWGGGDFVENAISHRLNLIQNLGIFWQISHGLDRLTVWSDIYDGACRGCPIVFDMRDLSTSLQRSLVRAMNRTIEETCATETSRETGRYPYVFFEEAHFYVNETAILNLITRGRHIGLASVFVTNSPQRLPDTVFRQLDNLFLLGLTHRDDINNVSRNSFTDEQTVASFATRMPARHALMMGNVTDRYPLVVEVDRLPSDVPATGETKSTWRRLEAPEANVGDATDDAMIEPHVESVAVDRFNLDDIPF